MKMNEYKTIKISPELHKKIKLYCVDKSLILNTWIENELTKKINKLNEKTNN